MILGQEQILGLCINLTESIKKEFDISYPSKLSPKLLYFRIKGFCSGIGTSPIEIVDNGIMMCFKSTSNSRESIKIRLFYLVKPLSQSCPGNICNPLFLSINESLLLIEKLHLTLYASLLHAKI